MDIVAFVWFVSLFAILIGWAGEWVAVTVIGWFVCMMDMIALFTYFL